MSFVVHKLETFSSNNELNFEVLVHFLRYSKDNKTLGLKYYSDIKDAPLHDLLRQDNINTEKKLMAFSDYSWQYFHTLVEVQDHILYFIKVGQLTMAHMFQY